MLFALVICKYICYVITKNRFISDILLTEILMVDWYWSRWWSCSEGQKFLKLCLSFEPQRYDDLSAFSLPRPPPKTFPSIVRSTSSLVLNFLDVSCRTRDHLQPCDCFGSGSSFPRWGLRFRFFLTRLDGSLIGVYCQLALGIWSNHYFS